MTSKKKDLSYNLMLFKKKKIGVVFLNSDSHPLLYNMTKCNILLVHVYSFHL